MRKTSTNQSAVSAAVASALTLSLTLGPTSGFAAARSGDNNYSPQVARTIGTGKDAIVGTGKDAIVGTGKDAIVGTGTHGTTVALKGPVQSYDAKTGKVSIFGRNLQVNSASAAGTALWSAAASAETAELVVFATLGKKGQLIGASAIVITGQYVPGASSVVISGPVNHLDPGTATAVVGNIAVDFSSLLANEGFRVTLGDIVTVTGTLPEPTQSVLATDIVALKR